MACEQRTIKYFLLLWNLLTSLTAAAMIKFGDDQLKLLEFSDGINFGKLIAIIIIVDGSIILLASFYGFCGAIRESRSMLMTFSVFMAFLILAQIGIGLALFLVKNDVIKLLDEYAQEKFKNRREGTQATVDIFQRQFQCCGYNGPNDYMPALMFPSSCCVVNTEQCSINVHLRGCKENISSIYTAQFNLTGYIGIAVNLFEVISFIFGCTLANRIRNEKGRFTYY